MELEEIRKKYQCDEGRTFAQWKELVRKNKPSQAQAHIVKAVAPNGSKYERVIGGYTDAQNTAFDLVSHGYKDVKLYHSVNAGPLKLLRNFSAPLHGAKFKDSADEIRQKYAKDAAFGVKVKGNEKGSERLTMEKVFKELNPAPAWKKVKKGNTIVIRTNINGKDQDVVTIKYFNPNVVAMTPKGGAANMVALKDVTVMCSKLGVEGRRSYNDSADGVERIRAKYSTDAYNLGMETKEFDPKAQLKVLSVTTKKEPDGISGRVTFTKGKKKTSERFMVYKSGNWDVTPGGGFGITGLTAGDKQALMNAVRNKLSTMGIKAR